MMAEIMEVFDDIKSGVGDKAFYILAAAAAAFGIYNLGKGQSEDDGSNTLASTRVVSTVASYPDAVTNANVIIDTLQNSIDYSEGQIIDAIQGSGDDLKEYLNSNFEQTNNYINDGFDSQKKLLEENFDDIKGGIDEVQQAQNDLSSVVEDMKNSYSKPTYIYSGGGGGGYSGGSSTTTTPTKTNTPKTTTKTNTTKKTTNKTEYYTYKTKAGMNTSTSIVDAIKVSTGNYNTQATYKTIKEVAKANGIKNYTGTYSQNVSLLSKMKSGKLKKA